MDQLPTEILADIINLLPVKNQLAIKSVNKIFNELALINTTFLDVGHIPRKHLFKVAKQMPKLTTIIGFMLSRNGKPNSAEISFVKKLATINRKMVDIRCRTSRKTWTCTHARSYLEAVKELVPSYTGSGLKTVFQYLDYMTLLKKYPDLDIKCELYLGTMDSMEEDALFFDTEVKTANLSHLVKLVLEYEFDWSRLSELLHKTVNVTHLQLDIYKCGSTFKLHPILEMIAKLPLKELSLEVYINPTDEEEEYVQLVEERGPEERDYKMTGDDYSSLRKVLNIQSLRIVSLRLVFIPDTQNLYDAIIESANNNLDVIEVSCFRFEDDFKKVYPISCSVSDDGYKHGVNVDTLTEFSIVDFMKMFNTSRTRRFEVICGNVKEWVRIRTEFEEFIRSHHRYTLARVTVLPFSRIL